MIKNYLFCYSSFILASILDLLSFFYPILIIFRTWNKKNGSFLRRGGKGRDWGELFLVNDMQSPPSSLQMWPIIFLYVLVDFKQKKKFS